LQPIQALPDNQPPALRQLLGVPARSVPAYPNMQVAAGPQAVQIFDSWGGVLTPPAYREFSLRYMNQIVAGLDTAPDGADIPVILFTKGGGAWLEAIAASGCHAIGLDWMTDPRLAREQVGDRVALQGNLDPAALYARPAIIREQVAATLDAFGPAPGYVFNLGHGITPGVDPGHVAALVAAVHDYGRT